MNTAAQPDLLPPEPRTFAELHRSLDSAGRRELENIAAVLESRGMPRPDAQLRAARDWTNGLRQRLVSGIEHVQQT